MDPLPGMGPLHELQEPSINHIWKGLWRISRRRFLKNAMLGSTAFAATAAPRHLFCAQANESRDPLRGLKLGIASYSLRKFWLDQAIAMTEEAGVKYVTLKSSHLPLESTRAERQEARKKIEAAGLVLMGGGVITMKNDEDEIRRTSNMRVTPECRPSCAARTRPRSTRWRSSPKSSVSASPSTTTGRGNKRFPLPQDAFKLVKDRHELSSYAWT